MDAAATRTYTLLRTTNLVSGTWQPVAEEGSVQTGDPIDLVETPAPRPPSGMYRIKVAK